MSTRGVFWLIVVPFVWMSLIVAASWTFHMIHEAFPQKF